MRLSWLLRAEKLRRYVRHRQQGTPGHRQSWINTIVLFVGGTTLGVTLFVLVFPTPDVMVEKELQMQRAIISHQGQLVDLLDMEHNMELPSSLTAHTHDVHV